MIVKKKFCPWSEVNVHMLSSSYRASIHFILFFIKIHAIEETCDHPAAAVAQPVFYSTQGASSVTSPDGARG